MALSRNFVYGVIISDVNCGCTKILKVHLCFFTRMWLLSRLMSLICNISSNVDLSRSLWSFTGTKTLIDLIELIGSWRLNNITLDLIRTVEHWWIYRQHLSFILCRFYCDRLLMLPCIGNFLRWYAWSIKILIYLLFFYIWPIIQAPDIRLHISCNAQGLATIWTLLILSPFTFSIPSWSGPLLPLTFLFWPPLRPLYELWELESTISIKIGKPNNLLNFILWYIRCNTGKQNV